MRSESGSIALDGENILGGKNPTPSLMPVFSWPSNIPLENSRCCIR
jgi:hypothetical protein